MNDCLRVGYTCSDLGMWTLDAEQGIIHFIFLCILCIERVIARNVVKLPLGPNQFVLPLFCVG